jgi:putative DNA primase/helicase
VNIESQFKNAMLSAGITPPECIIADGKLHRFKIDGKLNGAYVLHMDEPPAGYFQDFKQGIKSTWHSGGRNAKLSKADFEATKAAQQRQAEILETQAKTALKARQLWDSAKFADSDNAYCQRKKIQPHGAKAGTSGDLIVPLYNENLSLVNLQFIQLDGTKRFLTGGKKKGCFWCMGKPTETILISEGFATACSLFEETGCLTVIAFDAGNLESVSKVVRRIYQDAEIIIAGDNDLLGIGQLKARVAALGINGKVLIPPTPGHDFNDFVNEGGVICV